MSCAASTGASLRRAAAGEGWPVSTRLAGSLGGGRRCACLLARDARDRARVAPRGRSSRPRRCCGGCSSPSSARRSGCCWSRCTTPPPARSASCSRSTTPAGSSPRSSLPGVRGPDGGLPAADAGVRAADHRARGPAGGQHDAADGRGRPGRARRARGRGQLAAVRAPQVLGRDARRTWSTRGRSCPSPGSPGRRWPTLIIGAFGDRAILLALAVVAVLNVATTAAMLAQRSADGRPARPSRAPRPTTTGRCPGRASP